MLWQVAGGAPINTEAGDVVVVYQSAPSKAVVGAFVVVGTYRGSASSLWAEIGPELGVSHHEYWAYFDGTKMAQAIAVERAFEVPPCPVRGAAPPVPGFSPAAERIGSEMLRWAGCSVARALWRSRAASNRGTTTRPPRLCSTPSAWGIFGSAQPR